jgi:hypothetical protein
MRFGNGLTIILTQEIQHFLCSRAVKGRIRGRVAQIILEMAERGCPSCGTFDKPKARGISCANSAIRTAAGGTPALRSNWATYPGHCPVWSSALQAVRRPRLFAA